MNTVVVDASVLVKLVQVETGSDTVLATFQRAGPDTRFVAPALARYEVGHALLMRSRAAGEPAIEAERDLAMALALVELVDDPAPGVALAMKHGLTYYDASYLALAAARDARVWTYDAKLAKAAAAEKRTFRHSPG